MAEKDSVSGYVYSVSPKKKSRKAFPYFEFKIQTGDEQSRRVVCYDESQRPKIRSFQDSREPVKLRNITRKPSIFNPQSLDIFVNKRSKIEKANNSTIDYEFNRNLEEEETSVTELSQLPNLAVEQLLTVEGRVNFDGDPIVRDTDGVQRTMLERCAITDDTATVKLTLWNDLIDEVENSTCYILTNVRVKEYDSKKYLTTTPNTEIKRSTNTFPIADEATFQNLFGIYTIVVPRVELLDHYKKSFSCKSCNRTLTDISSENIVKCQQCGAIQQLNTCSQIASIRMAIRNDDDDMV